MVRVGSRSQNTVLEPCNINKQRGRRSRQLHHAYLELRAKREKFVVCFTPVLLPVLLVLI